MCAPRFEKEHCYGAICKQPKKCDLVADQQELLYILEGAGTFRIDGQQRDVAVGDAILARAGAEFALSNTGSGPLRYLVVKCRTQR